MFSWRRPDDLPPGEPSEDAIWEAIDRRDPQGDVDTRDRLEQHQVMLQGRDIFHNFFARLPLLPELSEDSVPFEDPYRWVTSLRLQCGEYHPLESSIVQLSSGTCDVLEPAADTVEPVGQSRLLSHRQLQSTPLEWPRDSTVGQIQSPISGYVHWARYVLQAHRETLRAAGIYEAVYASLFDYGRLPTSWARGLVEFWDAGRSTCWVGAEELTVTLSDLQTVSGLPVFGHSFDECVPPEEQLFHRVPSADGDRRGRLALPSVYPPLLDHYRQTYRGSGLSGRFRAAMPADLWIRSFLQEGYLSPAAALLHDPFGFGLQRGVPLAEETAEPFSSTSGASPALPGVDEDLLLAGFLALWLSTFVLPLRTGSLRCSILLAASQLSEGQRLALAPVVLARVYEVLRTVSEANSLEAQDSVLPWQYLLAWVHLHVHGAFSCLETPAYFLQRGFPTVLQLFQASSTFESERIRLFFFAPQLVSDRFALVHQPDTVSLPPHQRGTVVVDGVDRRGRRTLLLRSQSLAVAEYFISMQPGWLCHRQGGFVTLEGYQPNRVARQFGFSQATAYDGRIPLPGVTDARRIGAVPQESRFYVAALTWLHLLRLGTGSGFLLALPSSSTGVSYTRLSWVRLSFGPALEHGARRYERRVRKLRLSRGQRSRQGFSDATFDRGTDTEVPITAGVVVPSPARAPDVAPEPPRTETTRPSRRRVSSQRTSSSRMSVDIHSLLGDPDERAQRPRRSDFTGYSTMDPPDDFSFPAYPGESVQTSRGSDFTDYSTLDPPDDFSFPAYPYGSFCPGESSGTGTVSLTEFFGTSSYTPTTLDPIPTEFSFPEGHLTDLAGPSSAPASYLADSTSPPTVPEGVEYTSEISCHVPLPPDFRSADRCSYTVGLLRDLISSIDPRSPESWTEFVPSADRLLGLLASFGVSTTELHFWESMCRAAESQIRRLRSLSVLRTRATLTELEERVTRRREMADDIHDRLDSSAAALRRHSQSSSSMAQEFDRLTTRMQSLWRDVRQVMSQRFHLREGRDRRDRLTRREEQRHQALHQEMVAADSSLARAVEELQTAQPEFQTLAEVTGQLECLQARLF